MRKFSRKSIRRKNVAEEAYDEGKKFSQPKEEVVTENSLTLQAVAFRSLNNLQPIEVQADPNTQVAKGADPYKVIDGTNPVIQAKYPGKVNIEGNALVEMQNNTTNSKLMNAVDVGVICKQINYLYLPIKPTGINKAYSTEMVKSIEQAISFGYSTMLTQLAFTTDAYATNMPVNANVINTNAHKYLGALIHYQTALMNFVSPLSKYIELRSLEKELLRMSFRTEAPLVTELFGLLKKSSFIACMNMIGTTLINEYFDVNWYHQMNTLTCVPHRKSKGMDSPLLTLVGVHNIPDLTITAAGAAQAYYSSAADLNSGNRSFLNPENYEITAYSSGLSLTQMVINVNKLMSPAYVLRFVRRLNQGILGQNAISTTSAYVEQIKHYLEIINLIAARFSTKMSNIRTFLDKLDQTEMIYWKKGVAFFVDKIEQLDVKYNALLADVFRAQFAGADIVRWDNVSKRWRAYAFWNKFTGIPEYDRCNGGAFLTFGLRTISNIKEPGNPPTYLNFEGTEGLIPVLFSSDQLDTSCMIVSRVGLSWAVVEGTINYQSLLTDPYLTRLMPINDANISLRQPIVQVTEQDAQIRAVLSSAILQFIGNTFGFGAVNYSTTYYRTLDPDYVAFIDFEIEDVSNDMIVYARNYCPFRVSTPNGSRTVGFARQ